MTFAPDELRALNGNFTASERVQNIIGIDNVCERACMLAAGENAVLLRSKYIYKKDITFALSRVSVSALC